MLGPVCKLEIHKASHGAQFLSSETSDDLETFLPPKAFDACEPYSAQVHCIGILFTTSSLSSVYFPANALSPCIRPSEHAASMTNDSYTTLKDNPNPPPTPPIYESSERSLDLHRFAASTTIVATTITLVWRWRGQVIHTRIGRPVPTLSCGPRVWRCYS